jgi:hypothetical protein
MCLWGNQTSLVTCSNFTGPGQAAREKGCGAVQRRVEGLGFTRYRAQVNSSKLFLESLSFLLDCFYYDISLDYDILDKSLWAGAPGKLRPWEQIL